MKIRNYHIYIIEKKIDSLKINSAKFQRFHCMRRIENNFTLWNQFLIGLNCTFTTAINMGFKFPNTAAASDRNLRVIIIFVLRARFYCIYWALVHFRVGGEILTRWPPTSNRVVSNGVANYYNELIRSCDSIETKPICPNGKAHFPENIFAVDFFRYICMWLEQFWHLRIARSEPDRTYWCLIGLWHVKRS